MQGQSEKVLGKPIARSFRRNRNAGLDSSCTSITPTNPQGRLPANNATSEDVPPYKAARRGARQLARTRAMFLLAVAATAVAYMVSLCASKLGKRRWNEGGNRILSAGTEHDFAVDCTFMRNAASMRPLGDGQEEAELLERASAIVTSFESLVKPNESALLSLPVKARHRAVSLLVSLAVVEISALSVLVESHLKPASKRVAQDLLQLASRVSFTIPRRSMKWAPRHYYYLVLALSKLGLAQPYLCPLPRPERLRKLRELLLLQEAVMRKVRPVFEIINSPVGFASAEAAQKLDSALSSLSNLVCIRKNQVLRDPVLRYWLLKNEGPTRHSPIVPRAYCNFILQQPQQAFEELLEELAHPVPLCVNTMRKEIRRDREGIGRTAERETGWKPSRRLARNASRKTDGSHVCHQPRGTVLRQSQEVTQQSQQMTQQSIPHHQGSSFSSGAVQISRYRKLMGYAEEALNAGRIYSSDSSPSELLQKAAPLPPQFPAFPKLADPLVSFPSGWPLYQIIQTQPKDLRTARSSDSYCNKVPFQHALWPPAAPLPTPFLQRSKNAQSGAPFITSKAPGAHRISRKFRGIAEGEPEGER